MATKSNVISGMGVAMSLVQTLVGAVKKAGGTDEDIHRLTTADANGVWDKIAHVIIDAGKKVAELFTLVVDYGRSVKDSIKAGAYDWFNDDITDDHFPPSEQEQGKKEVTFQLFHFNKAVESDYAIAQMDKEGFRPATLRELLAFGETNPELQRQFPIIALGSVWVNRHGSRFVPFLDGDSGRRKLRLDWYDGEWIDGCRFLGVRK